MDQKIREWTRPRPSIFSATARDLARPRRALVIENALSRQQLVVVRTQVCRVRLTPMDRARMVLLAGLAESWQDALFIVKPDTVLRWHGTAFDQVAEAAGAKVLRSIELRMAKGTASAPRARPTARIASIQ